MEAGKGQAQGTFVEALGLVGGMKELIFSLVMLAAVSEQRSSQSQVSLVFAMVLSV